MTPGFAYNLVTGHQKQCCYISS